MKSDIMSKAEILIKSGNYQGFLDSLSEDAIKYLQYDWDFWGRPKQLEPDGDWRNWLLLAGRGFGKTRAGAEWIRKNVESGRARRIALVAPTAADVRDVMIHGESGIFTICPDGFKPEWEPSKRRLKWPNGAIATCYTAVEPERLRGPQHDLAWCDELASWARMETWDMLMFGLRLGANPRTLISTTPKPIPIIKELMESPHTHITVGSTYENRNNLAPVFFDQIVKKYEGTVLGRQELMAEVLMDVSGALWHRSMIDNHRVNVIYDLDFLRIVVAVDPAITSTHNYSSETGIVVAGIGRDKEGYVLEDLSCKETPDKWARIVVDAYRRWKADRIVVETNRGGEMVEHTIKTVYKLAPVKCVSATKGKHTRAEPIAAMYEQGKIHHVGCHHLLEDQMCTWVPLEGASPDRVDALVWAMSDLMLEMAAEERLKAMTKGLGALARRR